MFSFCLIKIQKIYDFFLPIEGAKVSYFFFPRKSSPVIHSFKSQNAVFFSREAEKKNTSRFFSITGKVHRSFIWILRKSVFFTKLVVFFFPRIFVWFLFFFFHGKVHMSFIHSILEAGKKKHNPEKKNSFFIHSFDIPQKVHKNELFRGNKKIRFLWLVSFYFSLY